MKKGMPSHVNKLCQKFEEELIAKNLEKRIRQAKSTLPAGARAPSATKRPSASGTRPAQRQTSSNGSHAAAAELQQATVAMTEALPASGLDVEQLDALIYNRLQQILGMPLMQRVAESKQHPPTGQRAGAGTAKATAAAGVYGVRSSPLRPPSGATAKKAPVLAGKAIPKPPRRPSWNEDWANAPATVAADIDNLPVGRTVGPGPGSSPARPSSTGRPGSARPPTGPGSSPYQSPATGGRPMSAASPTRSERVTLLPSPVAAGASIAARSPSTLRYGGAGAVDAFTAGLEAEGHAEHHHAGLGRSDMSTIAALNPSGHAARQLSSQGTGQSPGLYIRTPSAQPIHAIQGMSLLQSAAASPVSARAHTLLTPVSARAGSGQGGTLQAFCTPSATTSQGAMNAGMGQWPKGAGLVYGEHGAAAGSCLHAAEQDGMHGGSGADPDAQYDDDFEEYEDSDDGQDDAEHAGSAEQGVGLEHAGPHETRQHADVDAVRQSMAVLTHLLDIKISQLGQGSAAGALRRRTEEDVAASMVLVGAEEALGHSSNLQDGLHQSDLDYLANLGDPAARHAHLSHLADSGADDDTYMPLEVGRPAGDGKQWGDRQPFTAAEDATHETGLTHLRQQQDMQLCVGQTAAAASQVCALAHAAEDADCVELGGTVDPRAGTGQAGGLLPHPTLAAVKALAGLARSGQLTDEARNSLRNTTDRLFGSLTQLHRLMSGPHAGQLQSPPSGEGAGGGGGGGGGGIGAGFTPPWVSPLVSPTGAGMVAAAAVGRARDHSVQHGQGNDSSGGGYGGNSLGPAMLAVDVAGEAEAHGSGPGEDEEGLEDAGLRSLTPKNQLCAADVEWMCGLMQNLSASLTIASGGLDLPGL